MSLSLQYTDASALIQAHEVRNYISLNASATACRFDKCISEYLRASKIRSEPALNTALIAVELVTQTGYIQEIKNRFLSENEDFPHYFESLIKYQEIADESKTEIIDFIRFE
jgi:hypothetical protein